MRITTEGVALTARTGRKSRPKDEGADPKFDSMEQVDAYFGGGPVRAREAEDGTRWCRRCDRTARPGPNSAFCLVHYAERKKHMGKVRRQRTASVGPGTFPAATATGQMTDASDGTVAVPISTLRVISERSERMIIAVGEASAHYQRLSKNNRAKWIDELMLSAKELHLGIKYGLTTAPPEEDGP